MATAAISAPSLTASSSITPAVELSGVSPVIIEVLLALIIITMSVASFSAGYFAG